MLKKAKKLLDMLVDKLYQWALRKNCEMLEDSECGHLFWLLLKDAVPGVKNVYGHKNYDDGINGWQIFVKMELEPEYGPSSTWIMMKSNRQHVIAKSLSSKDLLDALMKAAQWDDIICIVPDKFKPMLNGKDKIEILKKGTVVEQLKIKYGLRGDL